MNKREQLRDIFSAALRAVQPDQALLNHLFIKGRNLFAAGEEYNLDKSKIMVVGAGKGAAPMGAALEKLLGDTISQGCLVVKYGHGLKQGKIKIIEASHPVPDKAGEEGAQEILELASNAKAGDLLICLFTGGASALLPAPAAGISLADLQAVTALLLGSGATIDELNTIRKHLSRISGGQLAKAAGGAKILSVIVSDVIGDDLGAIASGPTAPDQSSFRDCLTIIDKYELANKFPAKALQRLKDGAAGLIPETPKSEDPVFQKTRNLIIASNAQALDAAAKEAENLGYEVKKVVEPMTGEARIAAGSLIERAKAIRSALPPGAKPVCLLAGGETTVVIKGAGVGGRNQEMALTAALELDSIPGIAALFAGTDGTDGPTDAAGGFAFADTIQKMGGKERALAILSENDSYNALKSAGDLLLTGPTLTNVMDLAIILIDPVGEQD